MTVLTKGLLFHYINAITIGKLKTAISYFKI